MNYLDQHEFLKFSILVSQFKKIHILFSRDTCLTEGSSIPLCFSTPTIKHCTIELGESETILRMCEFARLNKADFNCLFLHSKSVTNPEIRDGQHNQFAWLSQSMKLSMPSNKNEANFLITSSIIHYILRWREVSASLNHKPYHYWIWNIFASKSSFARNFNLEKWIDPENVSNFSDHKFYSLSNRHIFAGFPLKLDSILSSSSIKPISEFFNEPHLNILNKTTPLH